MQRPVATERRTLTKTASYEAEPGEVGRVLLLYSGGLDTSVMLKWIEDEYEAEVVALTVNLGKPGEDYDWSGARRSTWARSMPRGRRARGVRARYVLPAIKANASMAGLPAVHGAGAAADREAAVETARARGCDTSRTAAPARATTRCGSR